MKTKSGSCLYAIVSITLATVAMCVVDGIISPPYLYKSIIKVVIFVLIPMTYFLTEKEKTKRLVKLFHPKKRSVFVAGGLGIGVFLVVMLTFFALGNLIDLEGIRDSLTSDAGVNADNFLYVALYISFFNSLLEEFFFRGYAFLTLKREIGKGFAYAFSSAMFALYHVGMTDGWFDLPIYILSMFGLFVGGCVFNYLNEKCDSILPSYIVHMFANFAINTIGLISFGII